MPHKHRRDKSTNASTYELPPSSLAAPLPVTKAKPASSAPSTRRKAKSKSRPTNAYPDDTPRAFQRLMHFATTRRHPSGLDDGLPTSKKRKRPASATAPAAPPAPPPPTIGKPLIKPGEKMADFSARVDAALPLANLIPRQAGSKDPVAGIKVKKTKTEKKMQRMYEAWRVEEERIRERKRAEEEGMEMDGEGDESVKAGKANMKGKGKKKRKRGKTRGEDEPSDASDDENWAKTQSSRPRPLGDVVQAPPNLTVVPRAKFKVRGADQGVVEDVPKSAGSLRRREELGEVRRGIVEGYRRMMEGKRGEGATKKDE